MKIWTYIITAKHSLSTFGASLTLQSYIGNYPVIKNFNIKTPISSIPFTFSRNYDKLYTIENTIPNGKGEIILESLFDDADWTINFLTNEKQINFRFPTNLKVGTFPTSYRGGPDMFHYSEAVGAYSSNKEEADRMFGAFGTERVPVREGYYWTILN